jgi:hypothetical protein
MLTSSSDHDALENDRVVVGVYAPCPPPTCLLGHVLRHAQPFGPGWAAGTTIEPGFVVTPQGHYTKTHIDLGAGALVHFVVSGTKIWILFPPTKQNLEIFRSTEWGHSSDISLEYMCLKADKIYFAATRPGSIFLQPANWFHAVITVHADPFSIHTSLEIVHLQSVPSILERIIPPIIHNLTRYAASPDQDWVDDIYKVLFQENVRASMSRKRLECLTNLVATIRAGHAE